MRTISEYTEEDAKSSNERPRCASLGVCPRNNLMRSFAFKLTIPYGGLPDGMLACLPLLNLFAGTGWDFGYLLVYAHSGAYSVYAFPAKAAIFRSACRLLPALAIILIPARILSKKSAMRSKSTSGRSSP